MRKRPERPLTITEKATIVKCSKVGDLFIQEGIKFKQLALSLKQNDHTTDIKLFVEKRIKMFEELYKED